MVAKDANGCVAGQACFVIEEPTRINVEVGLTNKTAENNGSIDLTVSGGTPSYTFNWSDLSGNTQPEDRTDLAQGTFGVTVTDANGCSVVVDNLFIADFEACQVVAGTATATNLATICLENGAADLTVDVENATLTEGFEQAYILTSGAENDIIRISTARSIRTVSYTHLTLPTNREV